MRVTTRRLWQWGLAVGLVLGVGVFGLREVLPVFSDDAAFSGQARTALLVVAVLQPIGALVFVGDGIYLGAGRFSFLAGSTVAAAVGAVGVLILVVGTGGTLTGIWVAIGVMILVRGLAMVLDQRSGFLTAEV